MLEREVEGEREGVGADRQREVASVDREKRR